MLTQNNRANRSSDWQLDTDELDDEFELDVANGPMTTSNNKVESSPTTSSSSNNSSTSTGTGGDGHNISLSQASSPSSSSATGGKRADGGGLLREPGKPAGLKNVGNTCWFNSIIQVMLTRKELLLTLSCYMARFHNKGAQKTLFTSLGDGGEYSY